MNDVIPNTRRVLFLRVIGSAVLYGIFVVLAVSWVLTHTPALQYTLLIPLVLAVVVLPRKLPPSQTGIPRSGLWLSYVRGVYFVVAVFAMLALPEILY